MKTNPGVIGLKHHMKIHLNILKRGIKQERKIKAKYRIDKEWRDYVYASRGEYFNLCMPHKNVLARLIDMVTPQWPPRRRCDYPGCRSRADWEIWPNEYFSVFGR